MWSSYLVALAAVVLMAVGWVVVQLMWRKAFPEACSDPDVLAGRLGCHGCDRTESCERGPAGAAAASGKESES